MKTKRKILALMLVFITAVSILASCVSDDDSEHTHSYSDGFCSCGAEDPTYEPPHEHTFVDGKCECGAEDPTYEPPHEHTFVDGKCECGAEDPTYEPPHEHIFVEGKCECGATEPDTPIEPENPGTGSSSNIPNLDDGGWLKP